MCNFKSGAGVGGIYEKQPNMSPKKCIDHCIEKQQTNPSLNAVTVDTTGGNVCYCEYNVKSWNADKAYKSCNLSSLPSRKLQ